MTAIQLGQAIHKETDNRYFLTRYCSSVKSIVTEKGFGKGILSACAVTCAKIYAVTFSYFCIEGAIRSIIDVAKDDTFLVRLRPLGDAGGWTALALFSAMTITTLASGFVREGEHLRLKKIFINWIQKNKDKIDEDPKLYNQLYKEMNEQFEKISSQCLFSKQLLSMRITLLTICNDAPQQEENSVLYKDRALEATFLKIQKKLYKDSSCKKYFHRFYDGLKSIKKDGGYTRLLGSLAKGVALPIILITGAALSLVGEIGLGKELFSDRENLTDIGHFGEWPFNAAEMIGVAYFMHKWCIINEGNFVRTKKIYDKVINSLEDGDLNLYNRLCKVASIELSQLATGCHYFKLPSDYKITIL